MDTPAVFISYSHDSDEHSRRVLELADGLMGHGVKVLLDQYERAPPEGWTLWMEKGLDEADFVLLICTETYLRRVRDEEEPGKGQGVRWEGRLLRTRIYETAREGARLIPVLLEGGSKDHIPQPLRDHTHYEVRRYDLKDPGYVSLYRHLTNQPDAVRPQLGAAIVLPVRSGAVSLPGGACSETGVCALRFRLSSAAGGAPGYSVSLGSNGFESAEGPFACDPWNEKTTAKKLLAILDGSCQEDDLRYVGAQLWSGLVSGPVQNSYKRIRAGARRETNMFHFRLGVPRELEDLPWESLFDTAFLASDEQSCIIRETPEELEAPRAWEDRGRPVGILVVMPGGTDLDLARERESIARWVGEQGTAMRMEVLDQSVTPDRLRTAIRTGVWDIVHFAGHARANERGEVAIRLNDGDSPGSEIWMEGERFAALFNVGNVRLVVVNCCRGAAVNANLFRGLSGLGPYLMRRRIPAVVAMRYDIPDRVALRFADEFYRVLLTGPEPGRVDLAVESGRAVVFQSEQRTVRGFITPVLYLAEGCVRPFILPIPQAPKATGRVALVSPGVTPGPEVSLPEDLLSALREGRCVPVVGPEVLREDVIRSGEITRVPPGPRELARKLAELSGYPQMEDFALSERGGGWLDDFVLQWVCQHFSSKPAIRHKMFKTIREAFQGCRPTATLLRLAAWRVPGFICTHFDGLLAQAAQELGGRLQVMNALQETAPADPSLPLLIQLRGSWQDDHSLILTEQQNNLLWDCLADLPGWFSDLVIKDYGRSLLFLGVHPRDPLVRRLCAELVNDDTKQRVGPVYFACLSPTAADEPYWENFGVQWLRFSPAAVVDAAANALAAGVP